MYNIHSRIPPINTNPISELTSNFFCSISSREFLRDRFKTSNHLIGKVDFLISIYPKLFASAAVWCVATIPPLLLILTNCLVLILCVIVYGFYKGYKKRMRICNGALEFGMELHPDKPRMLGNLDNFNQLSFWVKPRNLHSCSFQRVFIFDVELVTMSVSLFY